MYGLVLVRSKMALFFFLTNKSAARAEFLAIFHRTIGSRRFYFDKLKYVKRIRMSEPNNQMERLFTWLRILKSIYGF